MKPQLIKNFFREKRLFSFRVIIASILVGLLALLLLARLFDLQYLQYRYYSTQSKNNLLDTIPIAPNRGLIYDRNGELIAKNIPSFTLEVSPDKVHDLNRTLKQLQSILPITQQDIADFQRNMKRSRPYEPVPLYYQLDPQQVAQFYVNRYRFPGVTVDANLIRHYPLGDVTSQVLGYVGRINSRELATVDKDNYSATHYIGKVGIEKYYEQQLHGQVGSAEVEINANGKIIRALQKTEPVPGDNLYLTIDAKLQAVAQKALDGVAGSVVAIDPNNGQVLAMASAPTYDGNLFVTGISQANYDKLLNSPMHPLYNRAIHGEFAPGSTVKPFYALAALDQKLITPSWQIFDPGYFKIPGTKHIYHDWKLTGHGWVNVVKALYVSCDTFFYHLAWKLGISSLDIVLKSFNFGQATGIDMPDEDVGIVPSPKWKLKYKQTHWYTGDTIETGIGQGFMLVTPLQLAVAVATLATKGTMYQPTLLLKTQLPDGKIIPNQPVIIKQIELRNPEAWKTVYQGMQAVITNPKGTGWHFGRNPGYTVAAKTGTAQIYGHHRDEEHTRTDIPLKLRNNHLFIAFAPVKHPKIAIAVVVEHDDRAAIIARKVMDYYLIKEDRLHS